MTLANCAANSNTGNGFSNGGSETFVGCMANNNTGFGLGNGSGTVTLTNCILSTNAGGLYNGYRATLTNCTLSGNFAAASSGGGVDYSSGYGGSFLKMTGCTVTGNSATADGNGNQGTGGGIALLSANATLMNCTISGNTSANKGGGIYNSSTAQTLINCIIAGNKTTLGNGGGIYNLAGDFDYASVLHTFGQQHGGFDLTGWGGGRTTEQSRSPTTSCGGTQPRTSARSPSHLPATRSSPWTSCDVQGGYSGNLHSDPLFVSATDLHIKARLAVSCRRCRHHRAERNHDGFRGCHARQPADHRCL